MEIVIDKKHSQLGMNPSTASNRLVKDLLYKLVVETGRDTCFRCGEKVDRETLSIEHKKAWLDSSDPVGLYFDTSNIAYSHLACNSAASRSRTKLSYEEMEASLKREREANRVRMAKLYDPAKRKEIYRSKGY